MAAIETNARRIERTIWRWIEATLAALPRLTRRPVRRAEICHLSEHMKRDIGLIDSRDPRRR